MDGPLTDKQAGSSGKKKPRGKPFPKGQSGNPKGRPPNEFSITALLREAMTLNAVPGVTIPEGQTVAQAIRARLLDAAINSTDFRFLKEVVDRIDGKVPEKLVTGEASEALILKWEDSPVSDQEDGPDTEAI